MTVEGVLTTRLGALETEHAGFIQDGTAGIGLYLDAPMTSGLPAGTQVVVEGVLDERYGQRTLRITAGAVREVGLGILPEALSVATGSAGFSWPEPSRSRKIVSAPRRGSPASWAPLVL